MYKCLFIVIQLNYKSYNKKTQLYNNNSTSFRQYVIENKQTNSIINNNNNNSVFLMMISSHCYSYTIYIYMHKQLWKMKGILTFIDCI